MVTQKVVVENLLQIVSAVLEQLVIMRRQINNIGSAVLIVLASMSLRQNATQTPILCLISIMISKLMED